MLHTSEPPERGTPDVTPERLAPTETQNGSTGRAAGTFDAVETARASGAETRSLTKEAKDAR